MHSGDFRFVSGLSSLQRDGRSNQIIRDAHVNPFMILEISDCFAHHKTVDNNITMIDKCKYDEVFSRQIMF